MDELIDIAKKVAVEKVLGTLDFPSGIITTVNTDGSTVTLSITEADDITIVLHSTFKLSESAQDRLDQADVVADTLSLEIGYTDGDTVDSVTDHLTLPTNGEQGSAISWASSREEMISAEGIVTRPSYTTGDMQVTLTASIQKGKTIDTKTFMVTVEKLPKTDAEEALEQAITALINSIANVDLTQAEHAQTEYQNKGGDIEQDSFTDVTSALGAVQTSLTNAQLLEVLTATLDEITSATQLLNDVIQILQEKVTTLQEATNAIVLPEIQSKEITQFEFSTQYAGQVTANSKPMNTSNFQAQPKSFTIDDGKGNIIPVNLTWNIPQNEFATTPAASIGSAVESSIQDYFNRNGGLNNRTVSAWVDWDVAEQGNTFRIQSFQPGATETITLGGSDWSYFFDQQTFQGTDEDKSRNRTFTISDGSNTVTILLDWNMSDMSGLVSRMNQVLQNQQVNIVAEEVSDTTFKLVGNKANMIITVDGVDKAEFFN